MNKKLFTVIFLIFSVISIVILVARYRSLPNSLKKSSLNEDVKVRPEKLLWVVYNSGLNNLAFSMEVPYPGPYCDCYDGSNGLPEGVVNSQIEGGYFANNNPSVAKRKWNIDVAVFAPGKFLNEDDWAVPAGNFFPQLIGKKINEEFLQYDSKGKSYATLRLPDETVAGLQFHLFVTDWNSSDFGTKSREFAVFQKDGYTIYVSFEYDHNHPLYADVFAHMLKTFSFSHRKDLTYDEVNKQFLGE